MKNLRPLAIILMLALVSQIPGAIAAGPSGNPPNANTPDATFNSVKSGPITLSNSGVVSSTNSTITVNNAVSTVGLSSTLNTSGSNAGTFSNGGTLMTLADGTNAMTATGPANINNTSLNVALSVSNSASGAGFPAMFLRQDGDGAGILAQTGTSNVAAAVAGVSHNTSGSGGSFANEDASNNIISNVDLAKGSKAISANGDVDVNGLLNMNNNSVIGVYGVSGQSGIRFYPTDVSGMAMIVDNLNNVGIGVSNPAYRLDVSGIDSSSDINFRVNGRMDIIRAPGNGTGIWLGDNTSDTSMFMGEATPLSGTGSTVKKVGFYNGGWGLWLDQNHNVGINHSNTDTLTSTLDVNGDAKFSSGLNVGTNFTNLGNRLLGSNNSGWHADGATPQMVISNSTTDFRAGTLVGLDLHNDSPTNGVYSPMVMFSRRSASSNYNSAFASIGGKATGNGPDSNWVTGDLLFSTANPSGTTGLVERMVVDHNGRVGIGTTAPSSKLQLYDGSCGPSCLLARFQGSSSTIDMYGDGWLTIGGKGQAALGWVTSSDQRLKKNITPIENALDKVNKLNGVYFNWKDASQPDRQVGFIAQEVQKVLPEVVSKGENGYYSVEYGNITALLTDAIKELSNQVQDWGNRVTALEKENANLQAQVYSLNSKVNDLENRMNKLESTIK